MISGYFLSSFNALGLGSNSSRFARMYSFTVDLCFTFL